MLAGPGGLELLRLDLPFPSFVLTIHANGDAVLESHSFFGLGPCQGGLDYITT